MNDPASPATHQASPDPADQPEGLSDCDRLEAEGITDTIPLATFTHAELHKSKSNVRTNVEDAEATDAIAASIARHGLLVPLMVHPAEPPAPTPWGVLAGGRRLRAIGQLIGSGVLPADWPIPAHVIEAPDAEITELSLGENLLRRDLRPYEVHAGIAVAFDRGAAPAEIAANLGQTEQWVARNLRLGKLAPAIFDEYAAGRLSFDQAKAYAATEDTVLQLSVYDALSHLSQYEHTAPRIRALLKVGDREASRLLLFVGEAVYVGAGGRVEPDLFTDGPEARVRITDEPLLRRLAEERFAGERDRIRRGAKRPDLRFAARPPQYGGRTDESLAIDVEPGKLPAGDIVATIDVDDNGEPHCRFWWATRAAKGAAERGDPRDAAPDAPKAGLVARIGEALAMPNSTYAQQGREIVRNEYGLTADGLQLFRSLRRALLRRLLLDQGGRVARDYLIWAQARALLGKSIATQTGCRAIPGEWHDHDHAPPGLFDEYAADVAAEQEWRAARAALEAAEFMAETDAARSLTLFLELGDAEKDHAAAIVAGHALLRSADTPGFRVPAHDVLARACGVDADKLRRWWHPSPRWLGLFGRLFRLEAAQPFVDAATHAGFIKLKDADLTDAVATALDPATRKSPVERARVARWLPAILAFGPDPAEEKREQVKTALRTKAAARRPAPGKPETPRKVSAA